MMQHRSRSEFNIHRLQTSTGPRVEILQCGNLPSVIAQICQQLLPLSQQSHIWPCFQVFIALPKTVRNMILLILNDILDDFANPSVKLAFQRIKTFNQIKYKTLISQILTPIVYLKYYSATA